MADENDDDQGTDDGQDNAVVEQRARQLGWAPKEKFRGNPEQWVDAATYVKRGEEILPIVKENNRKLQSDVSRLTQHALHLEQLVRAGQESMETLLEHQEENTRKAVEKEKRALLVRLRDVRENGTIEEEFEIQDELTTLNASLNKPKEKEKPVQQPQQRIDPGFLAWQEENSDWFGVDKRKTALAVGIGEELRADPANAGLTGRAFYDKISDELDKMNTPARKKPIDKMEGGGNHSSGGGGGGGSGKKTYASLPQEAKEVCDRQEKKLVGEGRAFKDQAGWRKHYVEQYFKGE